MYFNLYINYNLITIFISHTFSINLVAIFSQANVTRCIHSIRNISWNSCVQNPLRKHAHAIYREFLSFKN